MGVADIDVDDVMSVLGMFLDDASARGCLPVG